MCVEIVYKDPWEIKIVDIPLGKFGGKKMGKFNWKITVKKVAINALSVLIAGGISVWQNNPYWLVALPVLKGLHNTYKHWND